MYDENVSEEEKTIQVSVINSESSLNSFLNRLKKVNAKNKDLALERRELAKLIKSTRQDHTELPNVIATWDHHQE